MCDSSFEEDLDRYRRNNVELAVALNELKADLNAVQMELLKRNRELQQAHAERASLQQELIQRDKQLSTWRALIMDLVTSNTQKYSDVMKKIGLVPAASTAVNRPPVQATVKTLPPPPPPTTTTTTATTPNKIEKKNPANVLVQRRQKDDASDFLPELSALSEESIISQLNESKSLEASPENKFSHVVSRRRASVPAPSTPPSLARQVRERLILNGETNGNKPTAKLKKMEKIIDENTPNNGSNGRPTRKTAPKNLSEPKLGTKLRRN